MQRRDFLRFGGAATLFLSSGASLFSSRARAQTRPKFMLSISAGGGWDMTSIADPKGETIHSRHYDAEHILTVPGTDLTYAPRRVTGGQPEPYRVGPDATDFFVKYAPELLLLRGLDMQTNSHDVGPRHMFGGSLRPGIPHVGALHAAIQERDRDVTLPMAFVAGGGYAETDSLVSASRTGSAFSRMAQPLLFNPNQENSTSFISATALEQIQAKERERGTRRRERDALPKVQSALELFERARGAEPGFDGLVQTLKEYPDPGPGYAGIGNVFSAQIAMAAFEAGQSVAATMSLGNFDTHAAHDGTHHDLVQSLLGFLDYVIETLKARGLWEDTILLVGSDFSRTKFNNNNGKDHHSVTHAFVFGGGRAGVIGATAPDLMARPVQIVGGEVVTAEDPNHPDAKIMQASDLIQSLRGRLGIDSHPLTAKYPVGLGNFGRALPLL